MDFLKTRLLDTLSDQIRKIQKVSKIICELMCLEERQGKGHGVSAGISCCGNQGRKGFQMDVACPLPSVMIVGDSRWTWPRPLLLVMIVGHYCSSHLEGYIFVSSRSRVVLMISTAPHHWWEWK